MWRKFRTFFCVFSLILLSLRAESQNLVYSFVDPCTKAVTNFSVPVQGGTTVFFLNQSRFFTASDVANGTFGSWVNQVYADYRKVSPCSVQSAAVTRNQITTSVVSSVVSSVMSSIGTSMSLGGVTTNSGSSGGGDDNASKGKTQSEKKKNTNNNGNNNNTNSTSSSNSSSNGGNTTTAGNNTSSQTNNSGNNTGTQNNGNNGGSGSGGNTGSSTTGQTGGQGNGSQSGGSNQQGTSQTSGVGSEQKSEKGSEVVATTTVNVDVRNDRGSDNSSGGGGGGSKKSSAAKQQKSNPLIVSSDLTSAQNLDKSFTGIINVGMSQSSLTGTSSWGVTSMVWFNLKQFALNGRYTMIKLNDKGTLKFIHNLNLTGAYSYGNVFGFLGYSIIMNAGKYGITGANVSGAVTKSPDDKNLFISPSITAFYTKPFQAGKKLTISPELYVISTPVVYSSIDKITVTDRYFSGFLGSGFDYQLSRRFKVNINYKANLSTNPEFPILSFFLIGSKINL